jgi:transcription antitermination factor NusA-like protein
VLKKKKSALYEAVKGKEAALAEVGAAVRKLQLAQRSGVGIDDVVTITVEVPEGAVARVIGKGGANLRKIEEVGEHFNLWFYVLV